jgi:signal transduction histidine kinase
VIGRIESWFRRANPEKSNRELDLRLEERYRERARIVRELHDTLFQGFLGSSLLVQEALRQLPEESPVKPALSRGLYLMRRAIEEGRDILHELRLSGNASMNLEQGLSLEQALCLVNDEFTLCNGLRFRIFVKGQSKELRPTIQEQIYLIGREALVNALHHSQATNIEGEVEYLPRRLRVVIRDNGCGIDPEVLRSGRTGHWGLVGMRERAASIGSQLRIWSRPGAGTEVEISAAKDIGYSG